MSLIIGLFCIIGSWQHRYMLYTMYSTHKALILLGTDTKENTWLAIDFAWFADLIVPCCMRQVKVSPQVAHTLHKTYP